MDAPQHDPNTCPACGSTEGFQEEAKRATWQPLKLERTATGELTEGDYEAFDYGDDCDVTGFSCRNFDGCGMEWPTLAALAADMERQRGRSARRIRDGRRDP